MAKFKSNSPLKATIITDVTEELAFHQGYNKHGL